MIEQADKVLAAASLLGTIVALLYSLWLSDLQAAATTIASPDRASRAKQADAIRQTFWTRAVPLAVASWLPVLVFSPVAADVLANALGTIARDGLTAMRTYDSVQAAFAAVYFVTLGLAAITLRLALSVLKRANAIASR